MKIFIILLSFVTALPTFPGSKLPEKNAVEAARGLATLGRSGNSAQAPAAMGTFTHLNHQPVPQFWNPSTYAKTPKRDQKFQSPAILNNAVSPKSNLKFGLTNPSLLSRDGSVASIASTGSKHGLSNEPLLDESNLILDSVDPIFELDQAILGSHHSAEPGLDYHTKSLADTPMKQSMDFSAPNIPKTKHGFSKGPFMGESNSDLDAMFEFHRPVRGARQSMEPGLDFHTNPTTDTTMKQSVEPRVEVHTPPVIPATPFLLPSTMTIEEAVGLYNLGFKAEEILAMDPQKFQTVKDRMDFSLFETNVDDGDKWFRKWWIEATLQ